MAQILDGCAIKGNQGIDVYPRDDGYHVEHFSLTGKKNDCTVLWTAGPFDCPEIARQVKKVYREIWDNPNA